MNKIQFSLFSVFFLIVGSTLTVRAQTSRIAIVNHADSTIVHIHQGLTIFGNEMDTIDCNFNSKEYISKELSRLLSAKYVVSIVEMPDSVLAPDGKIFGAWGIKKSFKSWLSVINNQYDFVVYAWNDGSRFLQYGNPKIELSGIYSSPKSYKKGVSVFSTLTFLAFRTSNLKEIDYNFILMPSAALIKEFKFVDKNLNIDSSMFPLIKSKLMDVIDEKFEYFLTKSYLIPQNIYDEIKRKNKQE